MSTAEQLSTVMADLADDARIRRYVAMRALGTVVAQADKFDRLGATLRVAS